MRHPITVFADIVSRSADSTFPAVVLIAALVISACQTGAPLEKPVEVECGKSRGFVIVPGDQVIVASTECRGIPGTIMIQGDEERPFVGERLEVDDEWRSSPWRSATRLKNEERVPLRLICAGTQVEAKKCKLTRYGKTAFQTPFYQIDCNQEWLLFHNQGDTGGEIKVTFRNLCKTGTADQPAEIVTKRRDETSRELVRTGQVIRVPRKNQETTVQIQKEEMVFVKCTGEIGPCTIRITGGKFD